MVLDSYYIDYTFKPSDSGGLLNVFKERHEEFG